MHSSACARRVLPCLRKVGRNAVEGSVANAHRHCRSASSFGSAGSVGPLGYGKAFKDPTAPLDKSKILVTAKPTSAHATPMDMPIQGVIFPSKTLSELEKPEIKISTLSNGLRVISQETYGQVSNVGLSIAVGSRFEGADEKGLNHLLEFMMMKGTKNTPHSLIVEEMELMGAHVSIKTGREQMMLHIDVLRDNAEHAMELLCESITDPLFFEEEIEHQKMAMQLDYESLHLSSIEMINEIILEAAYGSDSELGKPHFYEPSMTSSLSTEKLYALVLKYFTSENIVLSGSGIDHDVLVRVGEKCLAKIPSNPAVQTKFDPEKPSMYRGGEKQCIPMDVAQVHMSRPETDYTSLAIAFECGGWHSNDLFALSVTSFLLGGGSAFSVGGPGKGMYSRLYREVLNRYGWVESFSYLLCLSSETGLFGLSGSCESRHTTRMLGVMCNHMMRLKLEKVSDDELSRAKNQLKSQVLMSLESRYTMCEDLGRQLLTYGHCLNSQEMCERIDAVSAEKIQEIATKILESPPSIAAFGETNTPNMLEYANQELARLEKYN